jgi:hypothetical protein
MSKSLLLVFALALGLGTLAQAAPRDDHHADGMPTDTERAAWHQERCADRYAHRVGEIAYLETRLALTGAQRGAFDNWKRIVLSNAKNGSDACGADRPHDMNGPPSIVDRERHMEAMMKTRIEFLDAELPALAALYQTLTPEQKMVLDHGHGGPHGRHGHEGDGPGRHGPDGGPGADG